MTYDNINTHLVEFAPVRFGTSGTVYAMTYAGAPLGGKTQDPLCDGARALVALGKAGRIVTRRQWDGKDSVSGMIAVVANLAVSEGVNHGPVFRKYVPFNSEAFLDKVA